MQRFFTATRSAITTQGINKLILTDNRWVAILTLTYFMKLGAVPAWPTNFPAEAATTDAVSCVTWASGRMSRDGLNKLGVSWHRMAAAHSPLDELECVFRHSRSFRNPTGRWRKEMRITGAEDPARALCCPSHAAVTRRWQQIVGTSSFFETTPIGSRGVTEELAIRVWIKTRPKTNKSLIWRQSAIPFPFAVRRFNERATDKINPGVGNWWGCVTPELKPMLPRKTRWHLLQIRDKSVMKVG